VILLLLALPTLWLRADRIIQATQATLEIRPLVRNISTTRLPHIAGHEVYFVLMRTSLGIFSLGLLVSMAGGNLSQARLSNQRGCALIDKSHPPQFVLYEGKSESSSEMHLRLRNNTDCNIVVETDDTPATQAKRLPNGGFGIEPVIGSQDGVRLRLHYLIQDRQRGLAPKPAYGWGDSVFTYQVLAGQSVIFTVPSSHFRRLDIAVPFNYSWEGSTSIGMGAGAVVHRVYFLFDDLPADALHAPPRQK
jgi:hypothetical protein